MLKRVVAIPLFILYFIAISGMMVQIHFCGNRLADWQIAHQKLSCCCDQSAPDNAILLSMEEDGCCHNEAISLKIEDAQQQVQALQLELSNVQMMVFFVNEPRYWQKNNSLIAVPSPISYNANAPPGKAYQLPLYKLYHNYTYYS